MYYKCLFNCYSSMYMIKGCPTSNKTSILPTNDDQTIKESDRRLIQHDALASPKKKTQNTPPRFSGTIINDLSPRNTGSRWIGQEHHPEVGSLLPVSVIGPLISITRGQQAKNIDNEAHIPLHLPVSSQGSPSILTRIMVNN